MSVFNYYDKDNRQNNPNNGPDYRDLLPNPPPPGDVPSCAEGGVLGVLPGTMGCLQATEVIKIILQKGDICSGRVLIFDALAMKFTQVGLARQPDRTPIQQLIDYQGFCAGPKTVQNHNNNNHNHNNNNNPKTGRTMDEVPDNVDESVRDDSDTEATFQSIPPKEALEKLVHGWNPWVLDVRLATEHEIVALPFTDRVAPHRTVRIQDIPASGDVLVYCKAGARGKKACHRLIEKGVDPSRLYNLEGGILRWQTEVDPSMPRY